MYAVSREQPFFVVNADGSGLKHLPVYQGALAPSPKRVISRDGTIVFTSAAPSGPTFAAAATDVYAINLDGTGLRQVTHLGDPSFSALGATISADGAWIAFESNFSVSGPQEVNQAWMVRGDGTGLRKLSVGPDGVSSTSISADGSVVTFVQGGQIERIVTASLAAPQALTSLAISVAGDAVVSDDGTRVVFTLGPQSGPAAAVYAVPTDAPSDKRGFLSIYAPRFLSTNGVGSAAGVGPPSPGSLFSAYGANLALDELVQAASFPLPTSLSGISLTVNGQAVPLVAVTPVADQRAVAAERTSRDRGVPGPGCQRRHAAAAGGDGRKLRSRQLLVPVHAGTALLSTGGGVSRGHRDSGRHGSSGEPRGDDRDLWTRAGR